MTFRKFDHVERLGHPEVEGITIGKVYVYPKLDGTCGSVWLGEDGTVQCASRNRVLSPDDDNHGFCRWIKEQEKDDPDWHSKFAGKLLYCPSWTIYGEWLVPHTLKTYRDEAWRRFWVFDVFDREIGRYLYYEEYAGGMLGFDVIEPLCIIQDPSEDQLRAEVEKNTYLIKDGAGAGEGIVVKNYGWKNRYGRQPWAKIVRNEFKEENRRAFGVTKKDGERCVEAEVAFELCTKALVDKTRAKITGDLVDLKLAEGKTVSIFDQESMRRFEQENRSRIIPELLGRVFHDLVTEEVWTICKKWKNPTVDFKLLQRHVMARVKAHAEDLFA